MQPSLTRIRDRFDIVEVPHIEGKPTLGAEIAAGLRGSPKSLPSKLLYDDVGSALFEAITHLPEYYLTRAESEILHESGWEIVRALEGPVALLELGSGSAVKTRILIEEALRAQRHVRYSPIDISADALRASSHALVESYHDLAITAYAGDYFDVLGSGMLQRDGGRTLAMLMGSNIGNYEPGAAARLMRLLAGALRPGDGLLLGSDLEKDAATLERAYDDAIGVTAAFERNAIARLNREFGGGTDPRAFAHLARYDAQRGSVDSFLVAQRDLRLELAEIGVSADVARSERIHVESSYKFSDAQIAQLGNAAGLERVRTWHDRRAQFSVDLFVKR